MPPIPESAKRDAMLEADETPLKHDGSPSPLAGKRVMIVINCDVGGGVEHIAEVLRADMAGQGADVVIRFIYANPNEPTLTKLKGVASTSRDVLRSRPDMIIAFQPTGAVIAGLFGRLAGCPLRIIHQANVPAGTPGALRQLDKFCGSFGFYSVNIANTSETKRAFARYPQSYQNRLHLIEHGIAAPAPVHDRGLALAKYGIPNDKLILFCAARLIPEKGLTTIVEALVDQPGSRLVIAGRGSELDNLKGLAHQRGIGASVHFVGQIPRQDVLDLYSACDVFVFPSLMETFGLAPVEAAMSGVPVIASDLPVLREVLSIDGTSPVIFLASRDPRDWSRAITAVANDKQLLQRACDFSKQMQAKYGEPRMLAAYRELFRTFLAPHAS
jgi:L-malate glycosyltransferase